MAQFGRAFPSISTVGFTQRVKVGLSADLAGDIVAVAASAGAFTATIIVAGTALATATNAGALTATITLAAAPLATATAAGALTSLAANLAGTPRATGLAVGTLTATIQCGGAATATATGTGALMTAIWLTSADLATAILTGTLTVTRPGRGPMLRSFTISQTPVRASWPQTHASTAPVRPSRTAELVTSDG